MAKLVWQFSVSDNMVKHLDTNNELGLFFSALSDVCEEVCKNYDVEPWEFREEE
jgi:peroxiredoxin